MDPTIDQLWPIIALVGLMLLIRFVLARNEPYQKPQIVIVNEDRSDGCSSILLVIVAFMVSTALYLMIVDLW